MIYFAIFSLTILYTNVVKVRCKNFFEFIVYIFPIICIFIIALWLQKGVGTDYYSYFNIASSGIGLGRFLNKGEYFSYGLLKLAWILKDPQLFFLFSAIIKMIFFSLALYEINKLGYKLSLFLFLYFTLSLVFFNQFNLIRQYIAAYIIFYAVLLLNKNKYIHYIIFVFMASMFHDSAIFLLILVLIKIKFSKEIISNRLLISLILIILALYFINIESIIKNILLSVESYKHLVNSEYFTGKMSISGILTKIPKILAVLYITLKISKQKIKNEDIFMINISKIAILILIFSFSTSLMWRIYQYFDLFLSIPLLVMYNNTRKYNKIIYSYLLIFLLIKILIIPKGEYLYNSILF